MAAVINDRQLTGLDEQHLVRLPSGHRLHAEAADAFAALKRDAHQAGFSLAIASSYRSFDRQLAIWNGKASGRRPVHDDAGEPVQIHDLDPLEQMRAIMRFSALPGASRHHWGTDLDVYDANALPEDYDVQLSPAEVAPGGLFDPLHRWLDKRIASGDSNGFYRPYQQDRGGIAPERWHLSYAPLSISYERCLGADILRDCWDKQCSAEPLLLRETVESQMEAIFERYIAVPEGWC